MTSGCKFCEVLHPSKPLEKIVFFYQWFPEQWRTLAAGELSSLLDLLGLACEKCWCFLNYVWEVWISLLLLSIRDWQLYSKVIRAHELYKLSENESESVYIWMRQRWSVAIPVRTWKLIIWKVSRHTKGTGLLNS